MTFAWTVTLDTNNLDVASQVRRSLLLMTMRMPDNTSKLTVAASVPLKAPAPQKADPNSKSPITAIITKPRARVKKTTK